MGEGAVLADQIHTVTNSTDSNKVKKPFLLTCWEFFREFSLEATDELKSHGDTCEIRKRVLAVGMLGVDERERLRCYVFYFVMVGDDGVDFEAVKLINNLCVRTTTVDCNEESGRFLFENFGSFR